MAQWIAFGCFRLRSRDRASYSCRKKSREFFRKPCVHKSQVQQVVAQPRQSSQSLMQRVADFLQSSLTSFEQACSPSAVLQQRVYTYDLRVRRRNRSEGAPSFKAFLGYTLHVMISTSEGPFRRTAVVQQGSRHKDTSSQWSARTLGDP